MDKDKKRVLRTVLSYILSFLLSVCITLLFSIIVIRIGILNEHSLYKNLESSGYYDSVYNELISYEKEVIIPTGLPESIVEEAISLEDMKNDVNGKLSAQFHKNEYTTASEKIRTKLNSEIEDFFKETNYEPTQEDTIHSNEYIEEVIKDYENKISVPFGSYLIQLNNILNKMFWIAVAVLIVLSVIIVYFILHLHRWLHRGMRYLCVSAIGSSAMLIILPAILYIQHTYARLSITTESVYNLIVSYINNILITFIISGVIMAVVAAILFFFVGFIKKKVKIRGKAKVILH